MRKVNCVKAMRAVEKSTAEYADSSDGLAVEHMMKCDLCQRSIGVNGRYILRYVQYLYDQTEKLGKLTELIGKI